MTFSFYSSDKCLDESIFDKQHSHRSLSVLPFTAVFTKQRIDYLQYPLEMNQSESSSLNRSKDVSMRKNSIHEFNTWKWFVSILMYTNIFHRDQHNYCVCTQEEEEEKEDEEGRERLFHQLLKDTVRCLLLLLYLSNTRKKRKQQRDRERDEKNTLCTMICKMERQKKKKKKRKRQRGRKHFFFSHK